MRPDVRKIIAMFCPYGRFNLRALMSLGTLLMSSVCVLAQTGERHAVRAVPQSPPSIIANPPWQILFHDTVFLSWLFGSLVVTWLFSIVVSIVTIKTFYPPNAARFACWLAISLWGLFVTFFLFGHLFPYFLPTWFITALLLLLFVAGVIALITRRRPV